MQNLDTIHNYIVNVVNWDSVLNNSEKRLRYYSLSPFMFML